MTKIDIPNVDKNAKIVVAMSGGVDSSTVVGLLQEAGYKNLVGMTLLLYENDDEKGVVCRDTTIKEDCEKVAKHFGIEHHFIDRQDFFYEEIISPFIEGYLAGVTVNPCISCNRDVKFGALLNAAIEIGCDYVVTGHYIKWVDNEEGIGSIYRGNIKRDQSYFLAQVRKETISYMRFPLSNFTKEEVREHAKRLNVHVASKPASKDLCFVGGSSYTNILNKALETAKPGNFIDSKGNILGKHDGIHNFTVGQRKGIGLGGTEEPYFVVKIIPETNDVVVGPREELATHNVLLENVNWIGDGSFSFDKMDVLAKVRAGQLLVDATLVPQSNDTASIEFKEAIFGVAKGQTCAFYDSENRLLGGGYIN